MSNWLGDWPGDWYGSGEPAPAGAMAGTATLAIAASGAATATGQLSGSAGLVLSASGNLSGGSSVVDVRVSHVEFDSNATPCDVKVSWLAFDTQAVPCDVKVSWLAFDSQVEAKTEEGGGLFPAVSKKESRRLAAFRRNVAEQQAIERKLAADRQAQIEADKQAELDRIEQERQRVATIEAYRVSAPIELPVKSDIQQNIVEIEPYLLKKLESIAQSAKSAALNVSGNVSGNIAGMETPDYSDDIALIMLLLEAA